MGTDATAPSRWTHKGSDTRRPQGVCPCVCCLQAMSVEEVQLGVRDKDKDKETGEG